MAKYRVPITSTQRYYYPRPHHRLFPRACPRQTALPRRSTRAIHLQARRFVAYLRSRARTDD
jgi:hypothetical protein